MVCLDLTEMDDFLIQFAAYISKLVDPVYKIYFVHNIKFDYPKAAKGLINELDTPLKELVEDIIYEKIKEGAADFDLPSFEIVVKEKKVTSVTLADVAEETGVDLIITGKKISYEGSGYVVEKLLTTSKLDSALLMVPETAYHRISNILIPTDFSKASLMAVEMGAFLQNQADAQIDCQHVFTIPAHFFPYIPVDNLQEKMKKSAKEEWEEFQKQLKPLGLAELECAFTYNNGKNVAQSIYDHALQRKKDLIVISSHGKGNIASMMMGSVASRLIHYDLHIPLMIIKP